MNIRDQQVHRNLERLPEHFENELPERYMHLTLILPPFSNSNNDKIDQKIKRHLPDIHEQHLCKLPRILPHLLYLNYTKKTQHL